MLVFCNVIFKSFSFFLTANREADVLFEVLFDEEFPGGLTIRFVFKMIVILCEDLHVAIDFTLLICPQFEFLLCVRHHTCYWQCNSECQTCFLLSWRFHFSEGDN